MDGNMYVSQSVNKWKQTKQQPHVARGTTATGQQRQQGTG